MPAEDSLKANCLPLGLAHGWKLLRDVPAGQPVKWSDVAFDANAAAVRVRREMEALMRDGSAAASRRALEETAR
jgi:predicted homoserine dehydrogenase-like protein